MNFIQGKIKIQRESFGISTKEFSLGSIKRSILHLLQVFPCWDASKEVLQGGQLLIENLHHQFSNLLLEFQNRFNKYSQHGSHPDSPSHSTQTHS